MGFFSDLKEDLSQAVNELMPEDEKHKAEEPTEASEVSLEEMLKNIDEIPFPEETGAEFSDGTQPETAESESVAEFGMPEADVAGQDFADGFGMPEADAAGQDFADGFGMPEADAAGQDFADGFGMLEADTAGQGFADSFGASETDFAAGDSAGGFEGLKTEQESWTTAEPEAQEAESSDDEMEKLLREMLAEETGTDLNSEMPEQAVQAEAVEDMTENYELEESKGEEEEMDMMEEMDYGRDLEVSDETSVITEGMTITGDISTQGSIDVIGTVNGNIDALGKLNITGHVNGNSKAAEIYAESAKINGEVVSEGAVKIGASAVIIGNITATSAAIAGAVKGDIDVQGPVILDASAIVMGNIKSKSVQINNGAVIEGMCSQCYADVSPTSFFDEYKPEPPRKTKTKQGEQKDK